MTKQGRQCWHITHIREGTSTDPAFTVEVTIEDTEHLSWYSLLDDFAGALEAAGYCGVKDELRKKEIIPW